MLSRYGPTKQQFYQQANSTRDEISEKKKVADKAEIEYR